MIIAKFVRGLGRLARRFGTKTPTDTKTPELRNASVSSGEQLIPCLICFKYFRRPCAHAWQAHGIRSRQYKEAFGYDRKKAIVTDELREKMREHGLNNKNGLKNLKKSKPFQYKKGDGRGGKFKRSAQTIIRLKQQLETIKARRGHRRNAKAHRQEDTR